MDYNERIGDVVGDYVEIRDLLSRNMGPLKYEILEGLECLSLESLTEREKSGD